MSKKKTRKPSHNSVANLQDTILSILKKDRNATYNYKQIASKLNITDASGRNQIIKKLAALKQYDQ
jgi:ribonuclease R